jgi:hypothetical protein
MRSFSNRIIADSTLAMAQAMGSRRVSAMWRHDKPTVKPLHPTKIPLEFKSAPKDIFEKLKIDTQAVSDYLFKEYETLKNIEYIRNMSKTEGRVQYDSWRFGNELIIDVTVQHRYDNIYKADFYRIGIIDGSTIHYVYSVNILPHTRIAFSEIIRIFGLKMGVYGPKMCIQTNTKQTQFGRLFK